MGEPCSTCHFRLQIEGRLPANRAGGLKSRAGHVSGTTHRLPGPTATYRSLPQPTEGLPAGQRGRGSTKLQDKVFPEGTGENFREGQRRTGSTKAADPPPLKLWRAGKVRRQSSGAAGGVLPMVTNTYQYLPMATVPYWACWHCSLSCGGQVGACRALLHFYCTLLHIGAHRLHIGAH